MSEYLLKNANGQAVTVSGKEVMLNEIEANNISYIRNQAAALSRNDVGLDQAITTITGISAHISKQKFYTVGNLSDYIDFETGIGTWQQEIATWRTFEFGQDFESGIVNQSTADGKLSTVDTGVDMVKTPVKNWAKKIAYSLFALKQAEQTQVFNYVSSLEIARKRNFDLGLQKQVFLGSKTGGKGLLNLDGPTKDTTTVTKPFSSMTAAELNAFVSAVAGVWYDNCYASAIPNRFLMPLSDFAGLSAFTNPDYPLVTKFEALDKAFKAQFGGDFKILPVAYANKDQNGLGGSKNRYALYNANIETVKQNVPLAYTALQLSTLNGYQFESVAAAQFGDGVTLMRPQEFIYFDCNA